jgi:hypothetical protein
VAIEGESCILALPRGNITFRLTSVKPFYVGDIKAGSNSPKYDPEYHGKGKGKGDGEGNSGVGMIPPAISTNIPLKHSRGRPYKNPNVTVFL